VVPIATAQHGSGHREQPLSIAVRDPDVVAHDNLIIGLYDLAIPDIGFLQFFLVYFNIITFCIRFNTRGFICYKCDYCKC
jgi:hypothetical protein